MTEVRPRTSYGRVVESGRRLAARVARRIRRASCFIAVCWLFAGVPKALYPNGEGVEYPVKLVFLYNFTKFIEWPPGSYRSAGAPLAICIVGHDPFNRDIEGDLRTRI